MPAIQKYVCIQYLMPTETEPISHFSEKGHELYEQSELLQEVVSRFLNSQAPELVIGGLILGEGKYSSVRKIDNVAVKVSSPTTFSPDSSDSVTQRYAPPENLITQFDFLRRLGDYLKTQDAGIITPDQYFAVRSTHHAYLLCQQYMEGWKTISDWAVTVFAPDDEQEVMNLNETIRQRITSVVGKTTLRFGLADLFKEEKVINGGNLLVPAEAPPGPDLPLCIIDQPGPAGLDPQVQLAQ